ncbi:MarR family winged helix-turn-helix transcriptional regulator [Actinoplanes sp. DH11]|uniref:MarR family winged helix-turn-helix transcriptional regulator n=1 Tax=Actinoplanes sp. DH11 TaxID=2857011 RepID=UPI001E37317D|nr:MarR family transcriptional regulator [Actinoplanes sp. DH11]
MVQEVGDLNLSVGYALKQAAAALRTAMDAGLRPLGLSVSQYSCLELLGQRPGLSAAELARGAFVTRQSMHAVLLGLEERGLLERAATAPQGRALPTQLTAAGRAALTSASRIVAAVEQRMTQTLTAGGRDRLHADLIACVAALSTDPAEAGGDNPSAALDANQSALPSDNPASALGPDSSPE